MNYLNQLNEMLLSKNICEKFFSVYQDDFAKWLNNELPEVKLCLNQPQNTPWHLYNVLEHILHSVENINKINPNLDLPDKLKLSYVMFFHDLGKPTCHTTRFLDNQAVDSFRGHPEISANIFRRFSRNKIFEFNVDEVCWLIKNHDIFSNYVTANPKPYQMILNKENIIKLADSIPNDSNKQELLKQLADVGLADNLAQNLELAKNTIEKINTFQNMINNVNL